jgi:arabinan endo-1,5-alpha-L-arabinosidase
MNSYRSFKNGAALAAVTALLALAALPAADAPLAAGAAKNAPGAPDAAAASEPKSGPSGAPAATAATATPAPGSAPAATAATDATAAPNTTTAGAASAPAAATDRDRADAAKLRAAGHVELRVHDPSTFVKCGDEYWFFFTGSGVGSAHSRDMKAWTLGPAVFDAAPAWVAGTVPLNRNAHFWAPDVIRVGERYLLYYSVSSFGKNTSAIALATNPTLDPTAPNFKWTDQGVVIGSQRTDDFNAIDPALFRDDDGRLWMAFGSFWSGIKLVELDPATGKRLAPDSPLHALAHAEQIEAAFLHRHGGRYYLFVNHGLCCRNLSSTYNIRVGRADAITGPYLDREGRPLMDGGGTLVLGTEGPFIGPGHAGIFAEGGREWFTCHFYDGTRRGRPNLAIRPLTWDADGWPVVGVVQENTTP